MMKAQPCVKTALSVVRVRVRSSSRLAKKSIAPDIKSSTVSIAMATAPGVRSA